MPNKSNVTENKNWNAQTWKYTEEKNYALFLPIIIWQHNEEHFSFAFFNSQIFINTPLYKLLTWIENEKKLW